MERGARLLVLAQDVGVGDPEEVLVVEVVDLVGAGDGDVGAVGAGDVVVEREADEGVDALRRGGHLGELGAVVARDAGGPLEAGVDDDDERRVAGARGRGRDDLGGAARPVRPAPAEGRPGGDGRLLGERRARPALDPDGDVAAAREAARAGRDVRVRDLLAERVVAGERAEDGERVRLADAAGAGQGARRAAPARQVGEGVEPAGEEVRGGVGEAVGGDRAGRVRGDVAHLVEGLRLDDILDLFLGSFH